MSGRKGSTSASQPGQLRGVDPQYVDPTICGWWLACTNEAVCLIWHPALGDVPACGPCAERYVATGGEPDRVTR